MGKKMHLNDKLLAGLTLGFLVTAVAILMQHAEDIAAAVKGKKPAARDDAYAALPGIPTLIPVARNDEVASGEVRPVLLDRPACGHVEETPRGVVYEATEGCIGSQNFTYCLAEGGKATCNAAARGNVLVTVRSDPLGLWSPFQIEQEEPEAPLVTRNASSLPEMTVLGEKEAVTIPAASNETNAPLAAMVNETPGLHSLAGEAGAPQRIETSPGAAGEQDGAAADTPDGIGGHLIPAPRPVAPAGRPRPRRDAEKASLDLPAADPAQAVAQTSRESPEPPVVVAAVTRNAPAFPHSDAALPLGVKLPAPARPSGMESADGVRKMKQVHTGQACRPHVRVEAAPQAMMHLELEAPCAGGKRVEIVHDALTFAELLSDAGRLEIDLPLLDPRAAVAFRIEDGPVVAVPAKGSLPEGLNRLAISWTGKARIDLHGLVDGADWGATGHLWRGNAVGPQSGKMGYVLAFGDGSLDEPARAQVLTVLEDRLGSDATGFGHQVEFVINATNGPAVCGKDLTIHTIRIESGKRGAVSPLMVAMPPCEDMSGSVLLRGVIEPMKILPKEPAARLSAR